MKSKPGSQMIVALDTPSLKAVENLIGELDGIISFYKIGLELFSAHGWRAVDLVRKKGARIFLDLKLHDIPSTAAKTAAVIAQHEIEMFNVHCLGGLEMMKAARESAKKPTLLGVTILTSHRAEDLEAQLGIRKKLEEEVLSLAKLAKEAGLDGVVSSPQEIALLRKNFPKNFMIVTPGIRPEGAASDDQKRTHTPAEAFQAGADYLVIGRPITADPDPRKAAERVLNALA